MTDQDIQRLIRANKPLPEDVTHCGGSLDLSSYAHALPSGLESFFKEDLFRVLDEAPTEVPYLLEALRAGKVNSWTYDGECKGLVGTLENSGKVSIPHNPERPAERWFIPIGPNKETPATNPNAAYAEKWILEWMGR